MCLSTDKKEPFIAEKPIKCYKIVRKMNDGKYYTVCTNTPVPFETINGKKPFEPEDKKLQIEALFKINRGAIHSYNTLHRYELLYGDCCIFECEIPEGAKYWVGHENDLCSDKLIFKRLVDSQHHLTFDDLNNLGLVTEENRQQIINHWSDFLGDVLDCNDIDEELFVSLQNALVSENINLHPAFEDYCYPSIKRIIADAYSQTMSIECASDLHFILNAYRKCSFLKNLNKSLYYSDYVVHFLLKKYGFDLKQTSIELRIKTLKTQLSNIRSNMEELSNMLNTNQDGC